MRRAASSLTPRRLRGRVRPRNWPVRWRLAAVSGGLTLAILILFGAIVGNLAAQRVRDDFNREIRAAAADLAAQIQVIDTITNTEIVGEPNLNDFVSSNDATARIFDSTGVLRSESADAVDLGPPTPGMSEFDNNRVFTIALTSGQTGRIAGYVQYGRSESHVDSTINRLWLLLGAGAVGATLLAALVGMAIARGAMRPISALTAAARRVADTGDPSRHMPAPRTDDEVGELARTLEEMLRSLDAARSEREAAMRRQREFVADASHELRTPLTSILANLELLQEALDDPAHEEERAMVDSALRSSARMSRLVGDLLLLARADAGRPGARKTCDLAELAAEAALEIAPTRGDRELRIDDVQSIRLQGNPDELHRMVLNLLDNAVRYTPPTATIELSVRAVDGDAVIEVSDSGPGIPPEMREQIFDRFVRGNGPADTAATGGSGLGLAIVRAVARSHGGDVEIEDSPLGGALFRVRLPIGRTEQTVTATLGPV